MRDDHLAEHPGLHVIEEVAVVGPTTERIRRDEIAQALRGLQADRVLTHEERAILRLDLAPHAVEVNRVAHHRVIHQHDAQPFAEGEAQRPGLGELLAVERPDEASHVTGEMQLDVTSRTTLVDRAAERVQVRVGEYAATIAAQARPRIIEPRRGLRRYHVYRGPETRGRSG